MVYYRLDWYGHTSGRQANPNAAFYLIGNVQHSDWQLLSSDLHILAKGRNPCGGGGGDCAEIACGSREGDATHLGQGLYGLDNKAREIPCPTWQIFEAKATVGRPSNRRIMGQRLCC